MDFFKKIWNKIKNPHGIWLVLFYILFAIVLAGTLTLVIIMPQQTIWHYLLYPFAAFSFAYFVYTIVIFAPKMKDKIINFLKKYKFTNTMLENYGYRTIIFSVFSFIFNISYVIFMGVLAIMTKSAWYISITVYYLVLTVMKGIVFYSKKTDGTSLVKQAKIHRVCGILFLFLTIALSGIIVLIYTSNMYFEYAGLLIYFIAVYTFYRLTMAIINIFKAKRQNDLHIESIRNINLASAVVSIVVLQVAMFQAFAPEFNTSIANALTGGAVSIVIMILGVFMIIKANKTLKITKEVENEKQ